MLVQRFPDLVNPAERGLHVVLQLERPLDDGIVLLHLALQLLQAVGQERSRLAVGEAAACQRAQQGNHGDDDGVKAHACPPMFL